MFGRVAFCVALAVTLLAAAGEARSQPAPQWRYCDSHMLGTPDERIGNCTTLIETRRESQRNRAIAYNYRGTAWRAKGNPDRAIADYNEALRLNPEFAIVYYNRGIAWSHKREYDRAIADHNEAIRREPENADYYNNRGWAWYNKGDPDRAIADDNEAIRLDSKYVQAYVNRGSAWRAKGDNERAIADFNEAIKLDPKNSLAYANRGRAYLYSGAATRAFDDLKQASALDPMDAYHAIWLDIAGHRNKTPGRLTETIKTVDMTKWPGPVLRLLLGQSTPAVALAAAGDPDPKKKDEQVCEAHFYSGEWAQRQGDRGEAVRLYRLAAKDCARGLIEWGAANAELRALGESP